MRRYFRVTQGSALYRLASISLAFLLLFTLTPAISLAQSDNTTTEIPLISDNTSSEVSDNISIPLPSDNTSQEIPLPSDNTTPEIPSTSENTTSEPTTSDNTTLEVHPTSENTIPETKITSDNTTPETSTTENITPELPITSENVTSEIPLASGNTTSETPVVSENATGNLFDNEINRKAIVIAKPDKDVELTSTSRKIRLSVPKEAVSEEVEIELTEHPTSPPSGSGMVLINSFELNAATTDSGKNVRHFADNLEIKISHTEKDLKGINESSIGLYCLNEETRQWEPVPDSTFDFETLTLTAPIDHFSYYGEIGVPDITEPGRILSSQVNMHTGTASFSYPIELPPGPGGFQPSLNLNYNSGSVDEMKSKLSIGSWVGVGWTLSFGKISYNELYEEYYLDLNGISYPIYSDDDTNYHTNPEIFLKIVRSEDNTWEVWEKDGTYYRFGGTFDSKQYLSYIPAYGFDYSNFYRWDLSLIRDTNGNEATITYAQDIMATPIWDTHCHNVRASYPTELEYGDISVTFNSSWDDDLYLYGKLRDDTPMSGTTTKVTETRQLDSIDIEVGETLISSYEFEYDIDNRYYSNQYSTYFSGNLTLESLTQIGADGTSELPSMFFSYTGRNVRRHTDEEEYETNPGNPADMSRPYLTEIDNGYGGSITFDYTQVPDTEVPWLWTRQIVNQKVIDSGSDNQTYSYSYYSDNGSVPVYWGLGWDQEYCGYPLVVEEDAEGNYIKHFYYTTGTENDEDGDKLRGREYKTEWWSSDDDKLKEMVYDWEWEAANPVMGIYKPWSHPGCGDGYLGSPNPTTSDSGDVYIIDWANDCILKYDTHGNFITQWGSTGTGNGQFQQPKGIAVDSSGYVYVADWYNSNIQKFTSGGTYVEQWSTPSPEGIAIDGQYLFTVSSGDIWVRKYDLSNNNQLVAQLEGTSYSKGIAIDQNHDVHILYGRYPSNYQIIKFSSQWAYLGQWGSGQYIGRIVTDDDGYIYTTHVDYLNRVTKWTSSGTYVREWEGDSGSGNGEFTNLGGVAVSDTSIYCGESYTNYRIQEIMSNWKVQLDQVDEITYNATSGNKTSRTRYVYDDYANVVTEYLDGDISDAYDNATIHRNYYANSDNYVMSQPAWEKVYAGTVTDNTTTNNLKSWTLYYYDGNNTSQAAPPIEGNLTRIAQSANLTSSVSTYYTYDSYGNKSSSTDANGNTANWTYESTYHTYPLEMTLPNGLSENYTYEAGTPNLLGVTDVNGQTTTCEYDTFKRLTKVIQPGDTSANASIVYQYDDWGTPNQQNLATLTKVSQGNYLWQKDYFDGMGRVIQTHTNGESGHAIIASTTTYDNRGQVEKEYITQDISANLTSFQTPGGDWKYTSYDYDALGRVDTMTNVDGDTISHDYSTAWQDTVTNERGYKTRYYNDAFGRLIQVDELDASHSVNATTEYSYDVLGNLVEVADAYSNNTTMTYDWLSHKTGMSDPDMGTWSYGYDDNGNITSQTDAKSQTITFTYDDINRLSGKTYPAGAGMIDVTYSYDSTTGGNLGKGQRTGMTDALGTTSYKYDSRGRLIEQERSITDGLPGWNNRVEIAIDSSKIDSELTYFPILIHLSDECGQDDQDLTAVFDEVGANYQKIAITRDDGYSQLFIEVEDWDESNEEAWLWVSKDGWEISNSEDTTLYLYYDNDHADNPAYVGVPGSTPGAMVWDDYFVEVLHMGDGADTSHVEGSVTSTCYDKAGNNRPQSTTSDVITGFAQDFDLVNPDSITLPDTAGLRLTDALTLECISKSDNISGEHSLICKLAGGNFNYQLEYCGSNFLGRFYDGSWHNVIYTPIAADTWYHAAFTYDKSNLNIYANGAAGTPTAYTGAMPTGANDVEIGDVGGLTPFDGTIDEVRISDTVRSAAWIKATYYSSWDDLLTIGEPTATDNSTYTTQFQYDGADRLTNVIYPSGETVTQTYNGRGLPYSLSGNSAGSIVTSTTYNALGQPTQISLQNGLSTSYQYWGLGLDHGTDSYGKLWNITVGGLMDVDHTWDERGNLVTRFDDVTDQTETFTYDFLDRLTAVSGAYSRSYAYDEIGNITTFNGQSYTYGQNGAGPHAVTTVGSTGYGYDANGNMTTRGSHSQSITWDSENRPASVSGNGTATFVYDGDGNRVKKTEGGETILYVNKYYEVNLTTSSATSYYYLGGQLVAKKDSVLTYIHQDHLSGTALMTDTNGSSLGTVKYYPYGETRIGSVPMDILFTGQRLDDGIDLYFYNARYYDPYIGRFISADSLIPHPANPQSFNRYSYCLNNPLKYVDPSGNYDYAVDPWASGFSSEEMATVTVETPDSYGGASFEINLDTFGGWNDYTTSDPFDYSWEISPYTMRTFFCGYTIADGILAENRGKIIIAGTTSWADGNLRMNIGVVLMGDYLGANELTSIFARVVTPSGIAEAIMEEDDGDKIYPSDLAYFRVYNGELFLPNVQDQPDLTLKVSVSSFSNSTSLPSQMRWAYPGHWSMNLRTGEAKRHLR